MVPDPLPLSPRQQQILRLISQFMTRHGMPPTRADLAQALQLRNRQGIDQHLRALEHKGYLKLEPGIARGIRLLTSTIGASTIGASTTGASAQSTLLPLYGRVAAQINLDRREFRIGRFQPQERSLALVILDGGFIAQTRDHNLAISGLTYAVHGENIAMSDTGIAHAQAMHT